MFGKGWKPELQLGGRKEIRTIKTRIFKRAFSCQSCQYLTGVKCLAPTRSRKSQPQINFSDVRCSEPRRFLRFRFLLPVPGEVNLPGALAQLHPPRHCCWVSARCTGPTGLPKSGENQAHADFPPVSALAVSAVRDDNRAMGRRAGDRAGVSAEVPCAVTALPNSCESRKVMQKLLFLCQFWKKTQTGKKGWEKGGYRGACPCPQSSHVEDNSQGLLWSISSCRVE